MENSFSKIMSEKTDAELSAILEQKGKYQGEALLAVIAELEKRGLLTPGLQEEKAQIIESEKQRQLSEEHEHSKRRNGWVESIDLLRIRKDYLFTPLIIYANVLIWLVMVATGVNAFNPSVESLIQWGGNLQSLTLDGEQWRLFTCIFLHGGILHLLLNMYALLQVGAILEMNFGQSRYLLTYFATGIIASIASIAFHDNVVSVGASGAIFGLYGLLMALLITKRLDIPLELRNNLISSTSFFIIYNLVFGFAKEGIDNAAHIGGLISGFVIGFIYYLSVNPIQSKITSFLLGAVVLCAALMSPKFLRNKYGELEAAMDAFVTNEERALWMYREDFPSTELPDTAQYNDRLKTEGIDLWKENLSILNNLEDTPVNVRARIELLKSYCNLRIQSCETMQQLLVNDVPTTRDKLNEVESQIDAVINKLKGLN